MLLFEPPPSPGDLHFRVLGIPVRVHPFFWLTTLLFGLKPRGTTPPLEFIIWVVVVFVSILIHELGHALVQRHYGGHPRITLHGLGGLAACDDCDRRPSSQIAISVAGPMAGFLFAILVASVVRVTGHDVGLQFGRDFDAEATGLSSLIPRELPLATLYWEPLNSLAANVLVDKLFFVNIVWGLVNLLPVYPLDGGRVSRELCTLGDPRRGIVLSLQISIGVAVAMAVFALVSWQSWYTALMFGYFAYANFQTLRAYQGQRW